MSDTNLIDKADPYYPVCPTCEDEVVDTLGAHETPGWSGGIGPCTFRFHPTCCPGVDCDSPEWHETTG